MRSWASWRARRTPPDMDAGSAEGASGEAIDRRIMAAAIRLSRKHAGLTSTNPSVATLIVGFFTDLYRPAVGAAIADLVPPEARTRAYGYNYWAINLGAAVAPVIAGLGAAAGPLLFGADWPKVVDSAAPGKSLRAGDMGLRFVAEVKSETRPTVSWNVAAKLPGADRALSSQAIALTAHLDHLGIDPARKGDTIYNGALDNAVGVATLIEAARRFSAHPAKPRRSLLFVAMTAEEKGLIGSDYMSRNPLRGGDIVGLVNLDMPILTYDFRDVIAFGAEHSSIGQSVANAVSAMGLKTSPDPMPDESLFTRSDHYKFVQQGVPAVFLMTGFANGGAEKFQGFLKDCYHRPCDDLAQPLNYTAGARFAWVNYNIARELADADQPPRWNDGDFFGRRYAPKPR